jgi:hypothetical protein
MLMQIAEATPATTATVLAKFYNLHKAVALVLGLALGLVLPANLAVGGGPTSQR